jgi:hypothetical protein
VRREGLVWVSESRRRKIKLGRNFVMIGLTFNDAIKGGTCIHITKVSGSITANACMAHVPGDITNNVASHTWM